MTLCQSTSTRRPATNSDKRPTAKESFALFRVAHAFYARPMSSAVRSPRIRPRLLGLIGVFVLLSWAANAAVLAFDQFGYEYDDSINVGQLTGEMLSVSPIDVVAGFFANPFFALVNLAMLGSLVAVVLAEAASGTVRSGVLLIAAAVSVPFGFLAFLSILSTLSVGVDGEWLGEGWPILEAFFFWSVALCVYALPELGRVREARESASTTTTGTPMSV